MELGEGVSLSYVSRNFLRKDGTTLVSGSMNMNGNTLTMVSDPVNPQDVATKNYVDDSAGLLLENGGYIMRGYINMGFKKIKNLSDPVDGKDAANREYVDMKGAIKRDDNGNFFANGMIDMGKNALKNLPEPVDEGDAVNRVYVDRIKSAFKFDGISSYIANGAISLDGEKISNLGTPQTDDEAANKFYVDAINEETKQNIRLTKIHLGHFLANGPIIMNSHVIKGIPNPSDRDEATNKNYVDNGGAFMKNPNGTFSAVRNLNMKNRKLENLADPVNDGDAVNRRYVDARKPIISIQAEEQGPLKNGNYEFSYGNGSSGPSHGIGGYCFACDGRILRGSLMVSRGKSFLKEEVKVNLVIDGEEKPEYSLIKKQGEGCSCIVFAQPLEVTQCQTLNFITRTDNPNAANAYISLLVELNI